ncbi:MAG: MarR family transcriptional regulator [Gammaproteobacteria bacterium]|nr:MarR family transcriptional regulator [Gammaproteobacteria bacterium]
MKPGLGTQLRHLIELLDGAVGAAYDELGLDYRPRYTPVMRALLEQEPCTIGQIAELAGITQPAATQTIALMLKAGLITAETGALDGRQKLIRLSAGSRELLPQLQLCWQATAAAAASLEADMPNSLSETLAAAIAALKTKSYGTRIAEARARLSKHAPIPAE